MLKVALLIFLFWFSSISHAGVYFEFGIDSGGETFAEVESNDDFSYDEELNIGGGFKVATGYYRILGENSRNSITVTFGYMWDSISADNGDAEFETFTLDGIYYLHADSHRMGIGAAYHINPKYNDDIEGFAKTDLDFDDSLGLIIQYSYAFTSGLNLGLRYTEMDYDFQGSSVDASSVAIFVAFAGDW